MIIERIDLYIRVTDIKVIIKKFENLFIFKSKKINLIQIWKI
jgi:hypothetical protein